MERASSSFMKTTWPFTVFALTAWKYFAFIIWPESFSLRDPEMDSFRYMA
jgi:hypothetical protein